MPQGGLPYLTDAQLQELAQDRRVTPADVARLTPDERARFDAIKAKGSTTGKVKDFARGVAKGAGETAFNLGSMVNNTPVLGDLTGALAKLVGPEGTDPDAAFSQLPPELEAQSGAEKAGKMTEQIGEFFVPANATRLATIRQLVKLIPNNASSSMMKTLNKAAALSGRVGGEAASAAGVATVHGDETPESAAKIGAGGAAATEGMSELVKLLRTPLGKKLATVLVAGGAYGTMPNLAGLGASMGMYSVIKQPIEKFLGNPHNLKTVERGARTLGTSATRGAAGTADVTEPRRRRLER